MKLTESRQANASAQWIVLGTDSLGRESRQHWYAMDGAAKHLDSLVSGTVTLRLGTDREAVIARKEPNGEILYSDKYLIAMAYMVEAALRAIPQEMQ